MARTGTVVVACALTLTGIATATAASTTAPVAVVAAPLDESVPPATFAGGTPEDTTDIGRTTDTTTDPTASTTPPSTTVPEVVPDEDAEVEPGNDAPPPRAVPPQVRTSEIPLGSIVLALLVLMGVGLASYVMARRPSSRAPGASASPRRDPTSDIATLDFLLDLGESLIDAGDAVNHVESTLRTIARVNGIDEVGVLVLPTALIVSLPAGGDVKTEVSAAGQTQLRLDQIDDLLALVAEAEAGTIDSVDGRRRLAEIRASASPYPAGIALVGYTCSTIGLAAILRAGWLEFLFAGVLGVVIGSFRLSTRRLSTSYQPFVPLIAATAVSVSVFATARVVDDLVTFPLLVAPLITFLPGALLTIAVLELATGQIVAGASRLASGALQLVLLALGIVAGGQLVGVPAGDLRGHDSGTLEALAPWIGVAVFGVGVALFNGARRSATTWILLVLYVAYAGQVIGGLFFGSALSAFFGAVAMTPVAVLAARQPSGPAPLVTFLPGFWILVPGALGLEGVSRLLGDGGTAGSGAIVTTITSMVGISLGILLGLTLVADDPQRPWAQTARRR